MRKLITLEIFNDQLLSGLIGKVKHASQTSNLAREINDESGVDTRN